MAKKWLNLAHVMSQYHPLTALPAARRAHRRELAGDAEVARETALDLRARHGKGRAGGDRAEREEAREQPAARSHDARQRVHVLRAAARIDRAVARVLPHPIE